MPTKTNPLPIIPQPWQLSALATGEATLIIVPMVPQPKRTVDNCWSWESYPIDYFWFDGETPGHQVRNKCPYRPLAELYCQEEWAQLPVKPTAFIQRSWLNPDSGDEFKRRADKLLIDKSDWQPTETMPIEAARIWLRVTSIACYQFGQLTGDEQAAMGWHGTDDMPAFLGDDCWVWAVSVKAITPF